MRMGVETALRFAGRGHCSHPARLRPQSPANVALSPHPQRPRPSRQGPSSPRTIPSEADSPALASAGGKAVDRADEAAGAEGRGPN
jgi:hypothetical protein